jgi:O-antigen ligase
VGWRSADVSRILPSSHDVGAAAVGCVTVVALSIVQGGYFPAAWGWSALVLLWIAATALIVLRRLEVSRSAAVFVGIVAALLAWISASVAWSIQVARSVEEVQRGLVYLSVVLLVVLVVRPSTARSLLAGSLAGVVIVCAYALASRLFPEHIGISDPVAGYRLAEPFGYWNALGVFAAMGALLAFGFAVEAASLVARAASAASLAVMLPTLYFTFSRGAAIAVALGLAAALVLTPRRLATVAKGLAILPLALVPVLVASRSDALTHQQASLRESADAGGRVAAIVILCAVAAGAVAVAAAILERRVQPGRYVRVGFAVVLVALTVATTSAVFARYGSPWTIASRARAAFNAPPPQIRGDLNRRLLSFSGNGRAELWRVAWEQWKERPMLGTGAGTYERIWLQERERPLKVRDSHGVYLEMLAETGLIGLALLALVLGSVTVAALRVREQPITPLAFGAFAAYVVHAGVDWDWEMPGVTATAFLVGAALVVSGRGGGRVGFGGIGRVALLVVVLVASGFALVGLLGTAALSASATARGGGDLGEAATQASRASQWLPWSPRPHVVLGEIQLAASAEDAAARSFRAALRRDGRDWTAWLGLAEATSGMQRERALARATALNPHSPEIAKFRGGESAEG